MSNKTPYKSIYKPINEDKYVGNLDEVVCRSSWERSFAKYLDHNPNVTAWSSESIIIPYVSPLDEKPHRYFPDFYVKFTDGTELIIEIKPFEETSPPKPQKRKTKNFLYKVSRYHVNVAKWEAAQKFAKGKGMTFTVFTENELRKLGLVFR